MGCGESSPVGTHDAAPELPPPVDTGPVTDCTDRPAGTECDDGNPCTSGDSCDSQGDCIAANSTVCPDADNNPCTDPVCDPDNGDPTNGYCTEVPLDSENTEDVCYSYQCTDGEVTETEPSSQNDCADWGAPTGGCIDQYVCDPQYEAAEGGSHCRPVGKVNGTPCLSEGVGVKAATNIATAEKSSDCRLYVCHQQDTSDTALNTPQCVLSSTLPDDVQQVLEEAGHKLRHVCSLDESPQAVSLACNDWRCGCKEELCAEPECQVDPVEAKVGKPCDNGNLCDASTCMPAKGAGAVMECEGVANGAIDCDLFPEATCDVSGPCDPTTGCPSAMDVDASDANCLINSLCIDPFNTKCAPNDPKADPVTGCVVFYQDVGGDCTAALKEKDACVTEALCESKEGSIICKPTAYVDCDDGNTCTDNFCSKGVCEQTNLPGSCDDKNACTTQDTCDDGSCQGGPALVCDNGLFCDGKETCDADKGCQNGPVPAITDLVGCTIDYCDEDNDMVVHNPDDSVCDNKLFCDGKETCDPDKDCVSGTPPTITDLVGCTVDSCDEDNDQIIHTPSDSLCDDGQFCTGTETCDATQDCQPGQPPILDDGLYCTVDSCDEANDQVTHIAQTISCNDSDDNTKDDHCQGSGECVGTPYTCTPTQCEASSTPNGTDCTVTVHGPAIGCNDGNDCTSADYCSAGVCVAGPPISCDDGNSCTVNTCNNPGGCNTTNKAAGTSCGGGVCNNGNCVPCLPGQTSQCNPQCGSFNTATHGYRTCNSNNNWGPCLPATCTPANPTVYQAVPGDSAWHCNLWAWPNAFTMYLCMKASPVAWCGTPTIEFDVQKASNAQGSNFGPFDNNISVLLRNQQTGLSKSFPNVFCASQTTCSFSLTVQELKTSLGLAGTDNFVAEMNSPPGGTYVGTTGATPLTECY